MSFFYEKNAFFSKKKSKKSQWGLLKLGKKMAFSNSTWTENTSVFTFCNLCFWAISCSKGSQKPLKNRYFLCPFFDPLFSIFRVFWPILAYFWSKNGQKTTPVFGPLFPKTEPKWPLSISEGGQKPDPFLAKKGVFSKKRWFFDNPLFSVSLIFVIFFKNEKNSNTPIQIFRYFALALNTP